MTVAIRAVATPGEIRVAVLRGDTLLDYALWRPGAPDGVGDLHRGRIVQPVAAMAGAFVALAGAEGFLPDSDGAKGLTEGAILPVRVTRAAQGQKGPRLTAKLSGEEREAAGAGPVALIRRGLDPLLRLAARYPDAVVTVDDAALAATFRRALGDRLRLLPAADFPDEVAATIDTLSEPLVELPLGGRLSIWPTPALVAIDVDAGAAASGRANHELINRALLPTLATQIQLRNLSGAIVVDLAGMSVRRRAALGPDLQRALSADPLRPRFLGFTALGLAEIVRPRIHPPLHELLSGPLAAGLAALRAVVLEHGGGAGRLPVVRAAPPVVAALQGDPVALPDLARRTGRPIILRSDPLLPGFAWALENADA